MLESCYFLSSNLLSNLLDIDCKKCPFIMGIKAVFLLLMSYTSGTRYGRSNFTIIESIYASRLVRVYVLIQYYNNKTLSICISICYLRIVFLVCYYIP